MGTKERLKMKSQVEKNAYNFQSYCTKDRWCSYWYQINEVLILNPASVLEIGVGDKVLSSYLREHTNIEYKSMDLAADLSPDFLGSVDNMSNISDKSFDLVCAFEVLEHLPFEKFSQALSELKRVSRGWVIISLPHWGRHFSLEIRIPYFKKLHWQFKVSFPKIRHEFKGQHYWEIGKAEYGLKKIKQKIKNIGLEIVGDYVVFDSPYHHFFVLKTKGLK